MDTRLFVKELRDRFPQIGELYLCRADKEGEDISILIKLAPMYENMREKALKRLSKAKNELRGKYGAGFQIYYIEERNDEIFVFGLWDGMACLIDHEPAQRLFPFAPLYPERKPAEDSAFEEMIVAAEAVKDVLAPEHLPLWKAMQEKINEACFEKLGNGYTDGWNEAMETVGHGELKITSQQQEEVMDAFHADMNTNWKPHAVPLVSGPQRDERGEQLFTLEHTYDCLQAAGIDVTPEMIRRAIDESGMAGNPEMCRLVQVIECPHCHDTIEFLVDHKIQEAMYKAGVAVGSQLSNPTGGNVVNISGPRNKHKN